MVMADLYFPVRSENCLGLLRVKFLRIVIVTGMCSSKLCAPFNFDAFIAFRSNCAKTFSQDIS